MTPPPPAAGDVRRRWAGSPGGVPSSSAPAAGRPHWPARDLRSWGGHEPPGHGHRIAFAVSLTAAALLLSACAQASSASPSHLAAASPAATPTAAATGGAIATGGSSATSGDSGSSPGTPESSGGTARAPLAGPLRVTLYGDSIAWETEDALSADLTATGRATLKHDVFPGTAVCDWLSYMRRDLADSPPQAAILIFRGVNYTPCSHGPDGQRLTGAPLADRYEADTRTAVGLLTSAGVHVYLVRAPVARDDDTPALVGDRFARVAASMPNTTYVDAGWIVEGPDRTFVTTLPCLATETCSKTDGDGAPATVVRSPDGSHFCPVVPRRWAKCPVYSPGAIRFAAEVFEAVRQTQLG